MAVLAEPDLDTIGDDVVDRIGLTPSSRRRSPGSSASSEEQR
jgi:hypothetical protein